MAATEEVKTTLLTVPALVALSNTVFVPFFLKSRLIFNVQKEEEGKEIYHARQVLRAPLSDLQPFICEYFNEERKGEKRKPGRGERDCREKKRKKKKKKGRGGMKNEIVVNTSP